MKLAQFAIVGMLLHLSATTPVHHNLQDKIPLGYYNHQDPQLWLKSGKVEGDMVLTPEQQGRLYQKNEIRNGIIDTNLHWRNKTIPFLVSREFTVEENEYIADVLKEEFSRTCIRVVPHYNESDVVYITGENTGCWSRIGRHGAAQYLNLQRGEEGCLYYRAIVHAFLHAAGFYHQQSATERDDYVDIQWDNIEDLNKHQFDKYGPEIVSNFGELYDYGSVMHYPEYAFSKNGEKTIIPKENVEIGVASRLSATDIAKLNKMYGC